MLTATFRIRNMKPSLWDAETGETDIPVSYKEENGMTKVTLSLAESGSVFIVFRPSEKETERASDYTKTHKNVKGKLPVLKRLFRLPLLILPYIILLLFLYGQNRKHLLPVDVAFLFSLIKERKG